MQPPADLWRPSAEQAARTNLARFARGRTSARPGTSVAADYRALHEWSVAHPDEFWPAVWRFCGVLAEERGTAAPWDAVLAGGAEMRPPYAPGGPRWFTGAQLNFAENLLRFRDDHPALVSWNELGRGRAISYAELHEAAARAAAALRAHRVEAGDRVAAVMPNVPETVIAMLGTAAIGAVWTSGSPDFGVSAVVDRFGQTAPRVLVCAAAYRQGGVTVRSLDRIREIAARLPSVERVVVVPYLAEKPDLAGLPHASLWDDFLASGHDEGRRLELRPARLAFDHPIYILYSSGTTGLPKCMVHGAGGTLLQHLKELVLHTDLRREDRIFFYTTCGWMMWNWLVSALAVGATVVLYDGAALAAAPGPRGSPTPPPDILWAMAAAERVTVFGASAKYLAACEKAGLAPGEAHDLSALRAVLSTGSPLAAHSFDYVYEKVKRDVQLASISGGTDIVSCFVLGVPTLPVYRGEIQAPGLGMAVEVWDGRGRRVVGEPGELVCTKPFPSMPVAFWDDADGAKYRAAYFEHFPGVWRHGDWAEETPRGGHVIYGRSDATLNPGGVRIGTAEIYRQVEQIEEVVECLAVGHRRETGPEDRVPADEQVVLFVRLRDGVTLDEALADQIRRRIRAETSRHHVPKRIVQVPDLPRTLSGKVSEIAVREAIHGRPVPNADALANPGVLDVYRELTGL